MSESERFTWLDLIFDDEPIINRGGPGSGHFGHEGRPGERGGSLPGEGGEGPRYNVQDPSKVTQRDLRGLLRGGGWNEVSTTGPTTDTFWMTGSRDRGQFEINLTGFGDKGSEQFAAEREKMAAYLRGLGLEVELPPLRDFGVDLVVHTRPDGKRYEYVATEGGRRLTFPKGEEGFQAARAEFTSRREAGQFAEQVKTDSGYTVFTNRDEFIDHWRSERLYASNERLSFLDSMGMMELNMLGDKELHGDRQSLTIPQAISEGLVSQVSHTDVPDRSLVLVHNHPTDGSYSLSYNDVRGVGFIIGENATVETDEGRSVGFPMSIVATSRQGIATATLTRDLNDTEWEMVRQWRDIAMEDLPSEREDRTLEEWTQLNVEAHRRIHDVWLRAAKEFPDAFSYRFEERSQ